VEITDVALLDASGQQSFVFHSGDRVSIRLKVRAAHPIDDFVFGIGLFNADGVCCYGTNTYLEEMDPEQLAGDAEATFSIDSLDLIEGTYKLDVAVHKRDGYPYDYHLQSEITHSRRRHLSATSPVELFAAHPVHASQLRLERGLL
jgi:hypothetical protein